MHSGLYHFAIMALTLADIVENCTLKPYFYIFLYIDLCNYKSSGHLEEGFSKHKRVSREIHTNTNSFVLISYVEENFVASTV